MIAILLRGREIQGKPVYIAAQHVADINIDPTDGHTIIRMADGTTHHTAEKAFRVRQQVELELGHPLSETTPDSTSTDNTEPTP